MHEGDEPVLARALFVFGKRSRSPATGDEDPLGEHACVPLSVLILSTAKLGLYLLRYASIEPCMYLDIHKGTPRVPAWCTRIRPRLRSIDTHGVSSRGAERREGERERESRKARRTYAARIYQQTSAKERFIGVYTRPTYETARGHTCTLISGMDLVSIRRCHVRIHEDFTGYMTRRVYSRALYRDYIVAEFRDPSDFESSLGRRRRRV